MWSLATDKKLQDVFEKLSSKFLTKAKELENAVSSLHKGVNIANIKFNNTANSFVLMSNTQFIENRVYERDDEVIAEEKVEDGAPIAGNDTWKSRLSETFKESVTAINDWNESDENNDGLPFVLGTQSFVVEDQIVPGMEPTPVPKKDETMGGSVEIAALPSMTPTDGTEVDIADSRDIEEIIRKSDFVDVINTEKQVEDEYEHVEKTEEELIIEERQKAKDVLGQLFGGVGEEDSEDDELMAAAQSLLVPGAVNLGDEESEEEQQQEEEIKQESEVEEEIDDEAASMAKKQAMIASALGKQLNIGASTSSEKPKPSIALFGDDDDESEEEIVRPPVVAVSQKQETTVIKPKPTAAERRRASQMALFGGDDDDEDSEEEIISPAKKQADAVMRARKARAGMANLFGDDEEDEDVAASEALFARKQSNKSIDVVTTPKKKTTAASFDLFGSDDVETTPAPTAQSTKTSAQKSAASELAAAAVANRRRSTLFSPFDSESEEEEEKPVEKMVPVSAPKANLFGSDDEEEVEVVEPKKVEEKKIETVAPITAIPTEKIEEKPVVKSDLFGDDDDVVESEKEEIIEEIVKEEPKEQEKTY
eukprot:TRINITY_DN277_c0_g2_i1.p1 TRINITY_DN277_c0_g2~~TRINITY_DN277_c0_g2_i1.p1  ORF type:complete len:627 (-),score=334.78 TRINITY_DN277_c0_g2_i1:1460-3244(-)